MTSHKHAFRVIGRSRHKHRPLIRFQCNICPERMDVPMQTVRALVSGQAKRLRLSRIRHNRGA